MQTNINIEIISTIDELNQYLNNNITKQSLLITLNKLQNTI